MKHSYFIILGAIAALSCNNTHPASSQSPTIPEELEDYNDNCCISKDEDAILRTHLAEVLRYIANNDAEGFASCCYYPVERDRPLHDIADSVEMVKYFDTLFDDSIRNSLKNVRATDWEIQGWSGYVYGTGEFWASYGEGKIMRINYSSPQEQQLRQRIIEADAKSLHPSLRGNWVNEYCFRCPNGYTVRIDAPVQETDNPEYRMMIFFKGSPLNGVPDLLLFGRRTSKAVPATRSTLSRTVREIG